MRIYSQTQVSICVDKLIYEKKNIAYFMKSPLQGWTLLEGQEPAHS